MHDAGTDDDELLAPPTDHIHEDSDSTMDEESSWDWAHGFTDSRRAVRIWVDESSRKLQRVKLSPRWREILGSRTLEDAFAEAFLLANARMTDDDPLSAPRIEVPAGDPDLTWEDQPRIVEQIERLLERAVELQSRQPADVRWADLKGERVSASSPRGYVRVTLSLAGLTEAVTFDREWLDEAPVREIADAVGAAHSRAYAKYQPPTFIPGEHEELARELAEAHAALRSIAEKGL